jgi:hypothetical protein
MSGVTLVDDHLVPWFKVRGDDSLDQGIMRRCLLCGRTSRIVSSTASPSDVAHETTCEVTALRAALATPAPAGLDVTLLRRCIEEALIDDESGMETFSAEVVADEYARIYRARQPAPLTGEEGS